MREMIVNPDRATGDPVTSTAYETTDVFAIYGHADALHSGKRVMDETMTANDALQWVVGRLCQAKRRGSFTGIVAGAFDVPHDNHEWFLRNCRAQLAVRSLEAHHKNPTRESTIRAIADRSIFLAVSLDSDYALNQRKSGDQQKGGIKRPVYPYRSRAQRLAGYSFSDPAGQVHHTVDAVSMEGSPDFVETPLENTYTLANYLKNEDLLDAYITYDEHPADIVSAQMIGFDPIILHQNTIYATDPRTNQRYSSSALIRYIRGEY